MLLFQVFLLALFALVEAGQPIPPLDIYGICKILNTRLELLAGPDRRQLAFEAARQVLFSQNCFMNPAPGRIATSWSIIRGQKKCPKNVLRPLTVISECDPGRHPNMENNLLAETRSYMDRCLKVEMWDEGLKKATRRMSRRDRRVLAESLSDHFIQNFLEDNPQEPKLHLGLHTHENCCEPTRATRLIYGVVAAHKSTKLQPQANLTDYFRSHPKDIRVEVESRLVKPCKSYLSSTANLMMTAQGASEMKGIFRELAPDLFSDEFKKAIFKYQFCLNLLTYPETDRLIEALRKHVS